MGELLVHNRSRMKCVAQLYGTSEHLIDMIGIQLKCDEKIYNSMMAGFEK
jgi:hypothetical protein